MESETDPDAGEPEPPDAGTSAADSTPFAPIEPPAPAFDAAPTGPTGQAAQAVPPGQAPPTVASTPPPQPYPGAAGQLPPGVYGYPPYGYGYPNPQAPRGTNGMAIAALVLGICGFLFVTPIVGLVLGIVSLSIVNKNGQRGKGMAISGIVLSSLWIALFATIIVVAGVTAKSPAHRNSAGAVVQAGAVGIYDLHPGDCFTVPSGLIGSTDSHLRTMPVVPCSTPHDSETIGSATATDSSYPGQDGMRVEGGSLCLKLLSGYLLDVQSMPHNSLVQPIVPNEQAWGQGVRKVVCFIQAPSATLTQPIHRDASSYTAEQLRFLTAFHPVSDAAGQLRVLSLSKSTPSLTDLRQRANDFATAIQNEITALTSAPWSADVQMHIDALVSMHNDSEEWWTKAANATDESDFEANATQGSVALNTTDINAVREALGLSQATAGGSAST